uniref:Uncharacterized protein ycf23 n=1 Tax=Halydictyon mirabile TaxID=189652 RepID=A0A4D6WT81_9FLOR|nr:hypothetical protein [Halydictyon mirabile]
MNLFCKKLSIPFKQKKVLKIISGLNTLDINKIVRLVKAAELSGATYIDIAANTQIVKHLKQFTDLPICVSSIDPIELYNCISVGADLVEIGNFDIFYKTYPTFSISTILSLVKETCCLVRNKDICVTIPHNLSLHDQIYLAQKLEEVGINILQTEDFYNKDLSHNLKDDYMLYSSYLASLTLSSTYALTKYVSIPIITSSKMNSLSSSIAINCGASGIGISSNVYKHSTVYDMSLYIDEIIHSIDKQVNSYKVQKLSLLINQYNNILVDQPIY